VTCGLAEGCGGVREGVGVGGAIVWVGVRVGGPGVGVTVAGGVTCRTSFWSGSRIDRGRVQPVPAHQIEHIDFV
jgi:hypothetical protein